MTLLDSRIALFSFAFTSAFALLAAPSPLLASDVNEMITHIREVRALALSPNGQDVLATISDATADGGAHHLWLLGSSGEQPRQLTMSPPGERGEDRGEWTPDGKAIYFVSRTGGKARLYRRALADAETQRLVFTESGRFAAMAEGAVAPGEEFDVEDARVSPDGRSLALIVRGQRRAESRAKDDAYDVDAQGRKRRLFTVPIAGGEAREIALPDNVEEVQWHPSGRKLAIVTAPDSDDPGPGARLWIASAIRSEIAPEAIRLAPTTVHGVAWSPEGKKIGLQAQCADDAPPGCSDIYLLDLRGNSIKNLTRGIAGSVNDNVNFDRDGAVVTTISVGMDQRIARIDARGTTQWYKGPSPVMKDIVTNSGHTAWAVRNGGPAAPMGAMFIARLGDRPISLVTPPLLPAGWPSISGQRVTWENGGRRIEGIVYLPSLKPGVKVPLVTHVHGGPSSVFQDEFHPLVALFAERGWAVLQANPRGSAGYGTEFVAANKDDLGGEDFRDLMSGIDKVISVFPIDAKKLAMVGYSYGGTMSAFAAGKTDRFRAIVSGAPVINQISEYGTQDSSWYDRWYFGKPWDRLEDAWRQSPLATADKVRTPILLLQGSADLTDPPGQSQEMFRALRQAGAEVKLIMYPREDHIELHRNFYGMPSTEPSHGLDLRKRMVDFIAKGFEQQSQR